MFKALRNLVAWCSSIAIILAINLAYYLQTTMNSLTDINETPEELYETALDKLSQLGISDESVPENSPVNLVIHRRVGKVPFRRHHSAPVCSSTPIHRLRELEKTQNGNEEKDDLEQVEKLVLGLSLQDEQKKTSSSVFTRDDALAIRTIMARGVPNDEKKKLYYQTVVPHQKTKRMGLRMWK